ncbi:MAG TPA: hypothetical protein VE972_07785 [Conexibacter sp.]|nr:hypothetical protein [Conexibacter sp.]
MGVTSAHASRVIIEPAGVMRLDSVGRLTFTAEGTTIECAFASRWNISRNSEGTLSEAPEARNPRIGTMTEGAFRECTGGTIVELLSSSPLKYIYGRVVGHPEQFAMWTLHEYLVDDGLLFRCLYGLKITYIFELRTAQLRARETITLFQTPLFPGSCKSNPRIAGVNKLEDGRGGTPRIELS